MRRLPSDEKVTIIVPTLNAGRNIATFLISTHTQNHRPLEVVVVDGGSTDRTREIVAAVAASLNSEAFNIRLLHESDFGETRGLSNARNIGVLNSSSDSHYILFFDDDFELTDPTLVSKSKAKLDEDPCTGVRVRARGDTWLELHSAIDDFQKRFGGNVHIYCGYRRELFSKALFDPTLGFGEDYDFQARVGVSPSIVDVYCSRHFIRTFGEWRRQYLWYGRTYLRYFRKMWGMERSLRRRARVAVELYARAVDIPLLGLSLIGLAVYPPVSIAGLALFSVRLVHAYVTSASRESRRLPYLLLRQTYASLFFTFGLILGSGHVGRT